MSIRELVASPAQGSVVPREDANALVAALDWWLAPGVDRPKPAPEDYGDPIADYLELFDRVAASGSR